MDVLLIHDRYYKMPIHFFPSFRTTKAVKT